MSRHLDGQIRLDTVCLIEVSCFVVRLTDFWVFSRLGSLDCSLQTLMPSSVACYPMSFHTGQVRSRLLDSVHCVYYSVIRQVSFNYQGLWLCICRHELKFRRKLRRNQGRLFKVYWSCVFLFVFFALFYHGFNSHIIWNVSVRCKLFPSFRKCGEVGQGMFKWGKSTRREVLTEEKGRCRQVPLSWHYPSLVNGCTFPIGGKWLQPHNLVWDSRRRKMHPGFHQRWRLCTQG